MRHRRALSPRATTVLLAAAVVAPAAWVAFDRWVMRTASGWSALATHYAAGARPLDGSRGPTTVHLETPIGGMVEFRRRRQDPYMELGVQDEGFWLRSRLAEPSPPLFIPWRAVRRCQLFSAWVALPQHDGPPALARFTVHDEVFERACAARVGAPG